MNNNRLVDIFSSKQKALCLKNMGGIFVLRRDIFPNNNFIYRHIIFNFSINQKYRLYFN